MSGKRPPKGKGRIDKENRQARNCNAQDWARGKIQTGKSEKGGGLISVQTTNANRASKIEYRLKYIY